MRCLEISLSNTNFFFANKCLSLKGPNFEIGPTSEKRIFSALQKKIIKIITFHLYCTNTSVLREGTEGGGVRRGSGGDGTEAGRAPLHRAAMRLLRCCAVAACTALCAPGCVEAFALSAPAPHRTGPASWGREPRAAGRPAAGAAHPASTTRVRVAGALGLSGSSGRARTPASRHGGQPEGGAWTPPEGYVPKDRRTEGTSAAVPADLAGKEGGRAARAPSWSPPVGYVPNSRKEWQGLGNQIGAAALSDPTSLTELTSRAPGALLGGQGALQGTDEDDVVPLPDTSGLSMRERLMLLKYILSQMPAEGRQKSLAPREGVKAA